MIPFPLFKKSMRGSDPDAAVYYLARMIYAGEDIKFISRRIMICAAEDVGNADPQALTVAVSAARSRRAHRSAGGSDHPFAGSDLCGLCTQEQCGLLRYSGCHGGGKDGRAMPVPVHLQDQAL